MDIPSTFSEAVFRCSLKVLGVFKILDVVLTGLRTYKANPEVRFA